MPAPPSILTVPLARSKNSPSEPDLVTQHIIGCAARAEERDERQKSGLSPPFGEDDVPGRWALCPSGDRTHDDPHLLRLSDHLLTGRQPACRIATHPWTNGPALSQKYRPSAPGTSPTNTGRFAETGLCARTGLEPGPQAPLCAPRLRTTEKGQGLGLSRASGPPYAGVCRSALLTNPQATALKAGANRDREFAGNRRTARFLADVGLAAAAKEEIFRPDLLSFTAF